jgi:hypothetical protein
MSASEGVFLANPNTGAVGYTPAGTLKDIAGGMYIFAAVSSAWNGATATLQVMGSDGATLLTPGSNTTLTANGMGVVYLGPGQAQVTVSGGTPTALYATLSRVVG